MQSLNESASTYEGSIPSLPKIPGAMVLFSALTAAATANLLGKVIPSMGVWSMILNVAILLTSLVGGENWCKG